MFKSSAIHRLCLMAPKPQRSRHFGETALLGTATKKPRTLTTDATASAADSDSNPMKDAFSKYAAYLNDLVLFLFVLIVIAHLCFFFDTFLPAKGVISKNNKEEVLEKAEKDLAAVVDQYISRLAKELQGTDFWKLRRAYSPGVQEYVEAATLCNFCKTGALLNLDQINASLRPLSDPSVEPLQINVLDYLLGLADLTGELMRLAIGRISDGELEFAQKICSFVREIHRELMLIAPKMDDASDMKTKMDVMLQSVMKIENACFSVHVRGSEYIPFLGSEDTNFSLLGVPEIE
ncbi:UNVERIFIED_CONTAM: Translin-associated protein X [Sesamum indicum]